MSQAENPSFVLERATNHTLESHPVPSTKRNEDLTALSSTQNIIKILLAAPFIGIGYFINQWASLNFKNPDYTVDGTEIFPKKFSDMADMKTLTDYVIPYTTQTIGLYLVGYSLIKAGLRLYNYWQVTEESWKKSAQQKTPFIPGSGNSNDQPLSTEEESFSTELSKDDINKVKHQELKKVAMTAGSAAITFISFYSAWVYFNGATVDAGIMYPFCMWIFKDQARYNEWIKPLTFLSSTASVGANAFLSAYFFRKALSEAKRFAYTANDAVFNCKNNISRGQRFKNFLFYACTFIAVNLSAVPFLCLALKSATPSNRSFQTFVGIIAYLTYAAQSFESSQYAVQVFADIFNFIGRLSARCFGSQVQKEAAMLTDFRSNELERLKRNGDWVKKVILTQSSIDFTGKFDLKKAERILMRLSETDEFPQLTRHNWQKVGYYGNKLLFCSLGMFGNFFSMAGYLLMTAEGSLQLIGIDSYSKTSASLYLAALVTASQFTLQTFISNYGVMNSIAELVWRRGKHPLTSHLNNRQFTGAMMGLAGSALVGLFSTAVTLHLNFSVWSFYDTPSLARLDTMWGQVAYLFATLLTITFNGLGLFSAIADRLEAQGLKKGNKQLTACQNIDRALETAKNIKDPKEFARVSRLLAEKHGTESQNHDAETGDANPPEPATNPGWNHVRQSRFFLPIDTKMVWNKGTEARSTTNSATLT